MHAVDLAGLEHRHDVRMMQACRRARLGEEGGDRARIVGEAANDELDRDFAPQADLRRAEYHAHPAAPDAFEQLEVAEAPIVRVVEVQLVPQHRVGHAALRQTQPRDDGQLSHGQLAHTGLGSDGLDSGFVFEWHQEVPCVANESRNASMSAAV
jgi:hypothetical protein